MSHQEKRVLIPSPKITVAQTVHPHRVALMISGEGDIAFTVLLEPEQAKQIAKTIAEYALQDAFMNGTEGGNRV